MAVTSANNIYSALSTKNKGIGGLASGLDTDSLVEALTLTTRTKIAKQQQSKTLLQWKQTAYRSTASMLREFQNKYFKIPSLTATSNTYMKTSSFYNVYGGKSSNDTVKVTTSTGSIPGKIKVNSVDSVATNKVISTTALPDKHLIGDAVDLTSASYAGKTISVSLNGASRVINLSSLDNHKGSSSDVQSELQTLINSAFGSTAITVSVTDEIDLTTSAPTGKSMIELSATGVNKVSVGSSSSVLGLTVNQSNQIDSNSKLNEIFTGLKGIGAEGEDIIFEINGHTIAAKTTDTLGKLQSRISASGSNARINYDTTTKQIKLTAVQAGAGDTLAAKDVSGNFLNQLFGYQGGSTLQTEDIKASVGHSEYVTGGTFANGSAADISDAEKLLNTMISNSNGASFNIKINDEAAKTIQVNITQDQYDTKVKAGLTEYANRTLGLTGTYDPDDTVNFGFTSLTADQKSALIAKRQGLSESLISDSVNKAIVDAFGLNSVKELKVGFGFLNGKAAFQVLDTELEVSIESSGISGQTDLFDKLGYVQGENNKNFGPGQGTKINALGGNIATSGSFTIDIGDGSGAVEFTWDVDDPDENRSIQDLMKDINETFGKEIMTVKDGVVSISPGGDGKIEVADVTGGFLKGVFGVATYKTMDAVNSRRHVDEGKNALITIELDDGTTTTMESHNNQFTINGTTFEVSEKVSSPFTITVSTDTTNLVDGIKDFVESYNTMVEAINKMIYEDKESGYEPLTEEQRAEMTEEQITKWENEAKKGLLRADPALRSFLDKMRSAIYETVEAAGIAPYEIGLTTTSLTTTTSGSKDVTKSGTLQLDEKKLRTVLENNADAVRIMFTENETGLVDRLSAIIDSAASESSDPKVRGSLVNIAGTPTLTGNNTSDISRKIDAIDKAISNLKMRLENEYNRYWKKFSALETAISRMSAQSSWLTEQTSS